MTVDQGRYCNYFCTMNIGAMIVKMSFDITQMEYSDDID